jgi:hypothetical protein
VGRTELQPAKKKGKLEREEKHTTAITIVNQQEEPMRNGRRRNCDDLKASISEVFFINVYCSYSLPIILCTSHVSN